MKDLVEVTLCSKKPSFSSVVIHTKKLANDMISLGNHTYRNAMYCALYFSFKRASCLAKEDSTVTVRFLFKGHMSFQQRFSVRFSPSFVLLREVLAHHGGILLVKELGIRHFLIGMHYK